MRCHPKKGEAIHTFNWIAVRSLVLILPFLLSSLARAELSNDLEPLYSEAVLAYNGQDYGRALKLIDEITRQSPRTTEALELKALILRSTQDSPGTIKTYRSLIEIKTAEKRPKSELAPYHFELGVAHFKDNKADLARDHFQKAIEGGFNVGAAHFFLGMLDFQSSDWNRSEKHFLETTRSSAEDLKAPAHFYLGQIYFKTRYSSGGVSHLTTAKEMAKATLDDPNARQEGKNVAKQIYDAATAAIKPLDKSQFFGAATLMAGWDSNILTLPTNVSGSSATGAKTGKGTLVGNIGYMTSPVRQFQFIPSYQASYNKNTNKDSRSAEYFTQTLSFYINRKPLSRFSQGLKSEATFTFQRTVDPATDSSELRKLSLNYSFGPYVRYELLPRLIAGLEADFEPQNYYTDDIQTATSKLSGTQLQSKGFIQYDQGLGYLNPTFSVGLVYNDTDGKDYRTQGFNSSLSNTIYIKDHTRIIPQITFAYTSYPDRSTRTRQDKNFVFGGSVIRQINKRFTGLIDIRYTKNYSNIIESYQYNRFVAQIGVSYSFF